MKTPQPNPPAPGGKSHSNLDALAAQRPRGDGREARAHDRLVAGLLALQQEPVPAVSLEGVWRRLRRRLADARQGVAVAPWLVPGSVARPLVSGGGFALPAMLAFVSVWTLVTVADARASFSAPPVRGVAGTTTTSAVSSQAMLWEAHARRGAEAGRGW